MVSREACQDRSRKGFHVCTECGVACTSYSNLRQHKLSSSHSSRAAWLRSVHEQQGRASGHSGLKQPLSSIRAPAKLKTAASAVKDAKHACTTCRLRFASEAALAEHLSSDEHEAMVFFRTERTEANNSDAGAGTADLSASLAAAAASSSNRATSSSSSCKTPAAAHEPGSSMAAASRVPGGSGSIASGGGSMEVAAFDSDLSYICPISHEVMTDPVLCYDGTVYDRGSIEEWLERHDTSPMTGLPLASKTLTPNHTLRAAIQALLKGIGEQ